MAKFQITPDTKDRVVDAPTFAEMPDGTMGEILSGGYVGDIVIAKHECAVVSLSGSSGWRNFEDCSFKVRVLPKGTVVTLTQE